MNPTGTPRGSPPLVRTDLDLWGHSEGDDRVSPVPPSTPHPTFRMQQLQWLLKSADRIRSLLCLKAEPGDGFPSHSGKNSLHLPYKTLHDRAWRGLLPASPAAACPQSLLQSWKGQSSPPGPSHMPFPAWRMIPHFTPH